MTASTQSRLPFVRLLILSVLAASAATGIARADGCTGSDCTGDQSTGISVTAPPNILNIFNLSGPIQPASGTPGILLQSSGGLDLTVNSGTAQANVAIVTNQAPGIRVSSQGTPPAPQIDPFLNIPIPGAVGVSGGVVQVNSYSNITTNGTNAHGIAAQSRTTGYPDSVVSALQNFTTNGISFTVTSVANPDGTPGGVGNSIAGTLLYDVSAPPCDITDPNCKVDPGAVTPIVGKTGGTFTLNNDGTFTFVPGTAFDDLAVGASRATAVQYLLDGTRDGVNQPDVQGTLIATVTNTGNGLAITYETNFPQYGGYTSIQAGAAALPDLQSYVNGLIAIANGAGGAGNSVTVNSLAGTIKTTGASSYGVFAESTGAAGANGKNGGGFFSFGTEEPTAGGDGHVGGAVTVTANGNVISEGQNSIGVFAHSSGGTGGRGGNGGTYYYGRLGGTGGNGATVSVFGSGAISTLGDYASGIYALSEGGNGGDGGSGADVTGGGDGGAGGKGGTVDVEGNWNITTQGNFAYGIWAKSVGGNAGSGGNGGWIGGHAGNGGQATDGGAVTLVSGGAVSTAGSGAYGLFAQSVGGFGGSGGAGGSIFYSRGGSGESAGSGGAVSLTNQASGTVITHGDGSHALYAQSVGGGGGAGGGASAIVGVGGAGGAGGNGGTVAVTNAGLIQTYGSDARGIYAQSIGGGGGDGGNSAGLSSIGGSGSSTSNGGNVTVTNTGLIQTQGADSNAMFAQSIGGGGGSGGSSAGWFSIGGSGGGGGDAGRVTVNNSGASLQTVGSNASAIFAQSVGGGGGNGGNSAAVGAFGSLSIGGRGAAGGVGADVVVNSTAGEIQTSGNLSDGIFAQSIGGGGGDGGFSVSASAGVGGSLSIGVGGAAGGGGDAGAVSATNASRIVTAGDEAKGMFVESIGGGGGNGGFAISGAASDGLAVSFAIGGGGGNGGDGNAVSVSNSGFIGTSGNRSVGLQAQSVGGGGGDGGFSITGSGAGMGAFSLGIGGKGGSGGSANSVSVNNEGQIETLGSDALGLLVQSVGGGGGNGGFTIAAAGAGGGAGSIGIGGAGGLGGNGSSVTVNNAGAIDTSGDRATGLFVQSVGGGGGNGGFAITGAGAGAGAGVIGVGGSGAGGGAANTVTVSNTGNVHTRGEDALGLLAQSVGGGGGNGGFSIAGSGAGIGAGSLGIGGSAAAGGAGSAVEVTNKGMIETDGSRSAALFAQSVGGGGGNGGFSITGAGAGTGAGTFSLGGSGGGGGAGGTVDVFSQTNIVTLGVEASGIVAQSVGGGGGNGGFSIAGSGAGTGAGTVGIGGFAGGGGNGAAVTVKSCVLGDSGCDLSAGSSGQPTIETSGDRANGILAQSVGGGGGNGGFSIAGSGAGTGAGTFSLGGAGGGGGSGDAVTVESITNIATHGNEAAAIFAQSVGGGGGNGGFSIAGSGAGTGAGTLGIGGFGGDGGNGKSVTVNAVAGTIETFGSDSTGILAQSLGGGGGNGNFSIAGTGAGTGAGTLNIGGFAGGGGQGDIVSVTSGADVTTHGDEADGILAQSVGGGGGNGGFSITGSGAGTGAGALSIGGSGGDGGNANNVSVATTGGTIQTLGEHSTGIVAQSVGGGGGNGGFSFSGSFAEKATQFNVAVGGHGGVGGAGRNVDVSNSAVIDTEGEGSHGIFAQSVGGGGGTGGSSASFGLSVGDTKFNLSAALGGAGGSGNVGGSVTVVNEQSITTVGNDSNGVVAQSLGGGGGAGGSSLAINIGVVTSEKPSTSLSVDLAVGGQGGSGNHGGSASVTNFARLDTYGDGSNGIFAQSVGGGGGAGGTSRTLQLGFEQENPAEETPSADFALKLSVGGNGGSASNGGLVSVENAGDIATRGADSSGIYAQSIGGGGGSGGEGLLGVNPLVNALVQVKELKEFFDPTKISIGVGGSGGSSGDGGTVTVGNKGNIATLGLQSYGIFAQSVGGGGGLSTLYGTAEEEEGAGEEGGPAAGGKAEVGIAGKVGIGGAGGAAGNGGAVNVDHQGTIDTSGDDAHAIFAQSVGGGGGVAGSVERGLPKLSESQPSLDVGLGLAFGQAGGGGGDGGTVTVTSRGDIITRGAGANGILAQSIGGGGGLAGELGLGPQNLLPIEFAGSVGGAGSGGHVAVNHSGGITTLGNQANGIFAQSAGGQGTGGPVDVTIAGDVIAQGEGSHGIFAQSRGDAGAGNITITVTGGTVQGGYGFIQEITDAGGMIPVAASGVRFEDGANNLLTNHGNVTTAAGVAGTAISGTGGNEVIDNFGTVTGSVDLEGGANSFHNERAATLNSGTTLQLGTGNRLINDGTLSPGGSDTVLTTALTGDLRQGTSGTYLVSLDLGANKADKVKVAGSADLAGQVAVANLNAGFVTPGDHQVVILSSPGGITNSGLGLDQTSAVISYRLLFPDSTEVALGYDVNFSPTGLNSNQSVIGKGINSIGLAGGSSSLSPVLAALIAQPDARSLANAYDRLSPEPYLATATGTLFSNSRFSDAMHSCGVADGSDRFVREGECDWFRLTGGEARQEQTDSNMGFKRRTRSFSVGGQRTTGDGSWHAGFGFSYEHSTLDVDEFSSTSGDQVQIGGVVKKEYGATSLAADLSIGYGNYDTDRYVNLPGPGVIARSSQNVKFVSVHLRSARAYEQGVSRYLKPMIDFGVTNAWFPGFNETGAGGADLNVERRDETYVSLTPALEVGSETHLRNGRLLRPYARLGITQFVSGTSPEITASFQGAPVGAAPFTVKGQMDKTFADVNLGLTVLNKNGEILQIGYQGNFSDHLNSNSGMVKLSLPF